MTPAALLAVVYRFYPRGLRVGSPGYKETPEYRRRFAATRQAAAEFPKWRGMLDRLGARYGIHDLSLHVFGSGVDSAYSVKLSIPGMGAEHDALAENGKLGSQIKFGCCVSFLGPYYVVCHTNVAIDEPYVQDVTREVQATYRGYELVPPELGNVQVPDVALDTVGMGEVTIYNALLSTDWAPAEARSPHCRRRTLHGSV